MGRQSRRQAGQRGWRIAGGVEGLEERRLLAVPVVDWSTYVGGNSTDNLRTMVVDAAGDVYVAGHTYSQTFIAKIHGDGTLAWLSYLGTTGGTDAKALAVDGSGNVYVAGTTTSDCLGHRGFDVLYGGEGDGYLAKLKPDGTLAWATYLGGSGGEDVKALAVDGQGNVCVAGYTYSAGWIRGGLDTTLGGLSDGYVVRVHADGTLAWSSYLGGSDYDGTDALVLDGQGNVYVAGYTASAQWAGWSLSTPPSGDVDGYAAKMTADGGLVWAHCLGGSGEDRANGLVVDGSGNAYVAGSTESSSWPLRTVNTASFGGYFDAYVVQVRADGTPGWLRYMGGAHGEGAHRLAMDGGGHLYVSGYTYSAGWVSGGFNTVWSGGEDGFLAKLGLDGRAMWSTYVRGMGSYGCMMAVDASGDVGVVGSASTSGLAQRGFDITYNGGGDAYLLKVTSDGSCGWSSYIGGAHSETAYGIAFDPEGDLYVAGDTQSDGWISGGYDTSHYDGYGYGMDGFVLKATEVSVDAEGTEGADAITVSVAGEEYLVTINGPTGLYDRSKTTSLTIAGMAGNDTITVGADVTIPVIIIAGEGNDLVSGGSGPDLLLGGADSDTISGGAGRDTILGDTGNDSLYGGYGEDSVRGGGGDDYLEAVRGRDELFGDDGRDTLVASGTDCSLYGGGGNDSLIGSLGTDSMEGGDSNDTLLGNGGNDMLHGQDGADRLEGGDGDDELYGNPGNDTLYGGNGDDALSGQDGDDVIYGNLGNDSLYGNLGNDSLMGGLGADSLAGDAGSDSLYGGDDSDTISGGDGADYIEGKGKADTIDGGAGNDTIYGGAGADWIAGEDGDDRVDVGVSLVFRDSVYGGAGNDTVHVDGDDVLSGVEVVMLA